MNEQTYGLYWVRVLSSDTEWQPARFERDQWFLIGIAAGMERVAEVGPAIPPPFGLERA
jgi:hypothetical protein